MSGSRESLCITCGLPSGDPPRLNHLPNGRVCGACRDRLLEYLPPALPSTAAVEAAVELEEEAYGEAWRDEPVEGGLEEGPLEPTEPEREEAPRARPDLRALPPRRPGA